MIPANNNGRLLLLVETPSSSQVRTLRAATSVFKMLNFQSIEKLISFHMHFKYIFAPVQNTLLLFKLNLDFLQAAKGTKSSHHLSHDRASKGHGSIPGLMSQTDLSQTVFSRNQAGIKNCNRFKEK